MAVLVKLNICGTTKKRVILNTFRQACEFTASLDKINRAVKPELQTKYSMFVQR
jgi:hypothetical protein